MKKLFIYLSIVILTLISMGIGASILGGFSIDVQYFIEKTTAYLTLVSILLCIILSFDFEKHIKMTFKERIFSLMANSPLFLMYAGYVFINYNLSNPVISTIGFNVADTLRSILIAMLMYKLVAKNNA